MRRPSRSNRFIAILLAAILPFGEFISTDAPATSDHATSMSQMADMPGMHMPAKAPDRSHGCHDCDCPAGIGMIGTNCLALALPNTVVSLAAIQPESQPVPAGSALKAGLSIPPALPPPSLPSEIRSARPLGERTSVAFCATMKSSAGLVERERKDIANLQAGLAARTIRSFRSSQGSTTCVEFSFQHWPRRC